MWRTALGVLLAAVAAAPAWAAREDQILMMGNPAGSQTVAAAGAGVRAEFSFNDRGRGDHIVATWKLDAAGIPVEYSGRGNDYMKAPVAETFRMAGNKATWHIKASYVGRRIVEEYLTGLDGERRPHLLTAAR